MKALPRYVSLISVIGLLTGGALVAQTSGTSGTSGTNDPTRSGMSTTRPRNSATSDPSGPTNSGNSQTNDPSGLRQRDASGSTSSSTRANNGYDNSASANADPSASGASSSTGSAGNLGSSSLPGTSTDASSNSATAGTARSRNTFSGTPLSGVTDPLTSSIQAGDYSSRAQLASDVEQRLDAQKDSMKSLKNEGKRLQGQSKADFKSAWEEVEMHEKELRRSLKDLRSATQESWESVRSELASHYQAYMAALSRVQMQAGTGVSFPHTSPSSTNDPVRTHSRTTTDSSASEAAPTPATSP